MGKGKREDLRKPAKSGESRSSSYCEPTKSFVYKKILFWVFFPVSQMEKNVDNRVAWCVKSSPGPEDVSHRLEDSGK